MQKELEPFPQSYIRKNGKVFTSLGLVAALASAPAPLSTCLPGPTSNFSLSQHFSRFPDVYCGVILKAEIYS